jgi:hypothetical protein
MNSRIKPLETKEKVFEPFILEIEVTNENELNELFAMFKTNASKLNELRNGYDDRKVTTEDFATFDLLDDKCREWFDN